MTSTVPLILNQEPVAKSIRPRTKASRPNIAVVYADAFGQIGYFGGRPLSWAELTRSRYRFRYEVDLSDHRRTAQLDSSPLPARGDAYFFRSIVDVGFRVTKPDEVVRRNVTDALGVVYGYLISTFRPVTRRYDIQDAQGAETELNLLFQNPVELPEGITIYRCTTQLLPDRAAQDYLNSLENAKRNMEVGAAEHKVARSAASHEHELAGMNQRARLDAETLEHQALAERPLDIRGLIQTHLAKHPDESAYATELLLRYEQATAAQRDVDDKRLMDLVRYMIEQGMIQSVDMELVRNHALGRVQQLASQTRPAQLPAGPASWDDQLPPGAGPVLSLAPESAISAPEPHDIGSDLTRTPSSASSPAEAPSGLRSSPGVGGQGSHPATVATVPVYVVIDESPADPGYLESLNHAIQTLPADLARHPEIIEAIRLAVVGYADDVTLRMPLNKVAAESFVPPLISHGNSNLGEVFAYLQKRITDDVDRLKDQGQTVGRPSLYLLCATMPGDIPTWEDTYRSITDRTQFRYAPNVLVFGAGDVRTDVIRTMAAPPHSYGWIADPDSALSVAATHFATFVRTSVIALSQAHIAGSPDAVGEPPVSFRPVDNRV
jgi:uncharacterized protein YegL